MRVSALTVAKGVRPIEQKDQDLDHMASAGLQFPTCCAELPRIMLSMVLLTRERATSSFSRQYMNAGYRR